MPDRLPYAKPPGADLLPRKTARKAESDAFYSSARWRELRARFLRKHPLCAECERRGETTPATTIHHVKPRLDHPSLAYTWSNLEALCPGCHNRHHKTAKGPEGGYGVDHEKG